MRTQPAATFIVPPGGTTAYACRLRRIRPQPIVSIRVRCPEERVSETVFRALRDLEEFLGDRSIRTAGPAFTRWWSISDLDGLDLEVGYPVAMPVEGRGRVVSSWLPGGEVVATSHFGPMGDAADAADALERWCRENGRLASGPNWELHWSEPGVPHAAAWRIEVVRPLRPVAS